MQPVERTGRDVRLHPVGPLRGTVRLPGSKSLTNRYLACTALADGRSLLRGASLSDDAHAMLAALGALGINAGVEDEAGTLSVVGGRGHIPETDADLNVGHAGTAMRFLTALVALGHGRYRLDGSPRMRQRPIGPLVDGLRALGALVEYEGVEGYPPLVVHARGLAGGEVAFATPPSSQYVSALLMVAPYAQQDVLVSVAGRLTSRPYVDMTIATMRALGVEVLEGDDQRFVVAASQRYRAGEYTIEPDATAATYFWSAAAITGGAVLVRGLTRASRQGDVGFVDVLAQMGCRLHASAEGLGVAAPADGRLRGVAVDLNEMPDTVQTLAVTALFADGPTEIRNVGNLRIKETDRIAALASELGRLGARVTARADGLTIHPPARVQPAAIETYDDHRMAMSFALAGLCVDGVVIREAGCVSKSFPGFFDALARLAANADGPPPAFETPA